MEGFQNSLSDLLTRTDISSCTSFYLSDRQASKIDTSMENLETKAYYLNKFIEDLMSLFVWENLPDNIPSWIIEYFLLSTGKCLMYQDKGGKFKISRYIMQSYNDYREPMTVQTISTGTYEAVNEPILDYTEFEYCWNNNTGVPAFSVAYELAEKIYHIDKTIRYLQKQMRRPIIFRGGSKTAQQSIDKMMNENDPKTYYILDKDMQTDIPFEGFPVTNVDVSRQLEVMMKLRMTYYQEWNSRVALHSIIQEKKERNTEFEAESFSEQGNINVAGMYQQRVRFQDFMNKHWNLNTKVSYNPIIKTRGEEPIYEEPTEGEEMSNDDM